MDVVRINPLLLDGAILLSALLGFVLPFVGNRFYSEEQAA